MQRRISRRSLVKGLVGATALAALGAGLGPPPRTVSASRSPATRISAWVWQFNADGNPERVRQEAAARNMRVILKSHDGVTWMSKWDNDPEAVSGPEQIRRLRSYFAEYNVPLDIWCVPKGQDALAEADMCAQVLDTGVKRLYLDLEEGHNNQFWQGSGHDAIVFGQELRRRHPDATLIVAPDSRPWQIKDIPMAEFAAFSDEIAPQSYWKMFNTPANYRFMEAAGFRPGPDGITPELMLDATMHTFEPFHRKVAPIGDGEASGEEWARFVRGAEARHLAGVSVWRFGNTNPDVWDSIAAPVPTSQMAWRARASTWRRAGQLAQNLPQ